MQQENTQGFLQEAMERYGDAVYRLALCRTQRVQDAEDVYQEVFLRLFKEPPLLQGGEHLKAWLLRVALHRCADLHRAAFFRRALPLEEAAKVAAEVPDGCAPLWQAVAALPVRFRTVVHLHYVEGYGTDEIASMLGCRPATVRTRLHRARKKLKAELEDWENETEYAGRSSHLTEHESA